VGNFVLTSSPLNESYLFFVTKRSHQIEPFLRHQSGLHQFGGKKNGLLIACLQPSLSTSFHLVIYPSVP
jgi:hypothetical protein